MFPNRPFLAFCALVLLSVACSGPDRRDDDPPETCGNGTLDEGETCDRAIHEGTGACPAACDDAVACTADSLAGSADACSAACVHTPISACAAGDGCCPAGCTPATDADCSSTCGNGRIEPGETCDKAIPAGDGACPASCDDGDACTSDVPSGSAEGCSAACSHARITACVGGDGCCAAGCTAANDPDCGPKCGNGVVEPGETCDGNCPTTCNDGLPCTVDTLTGDPLACTAACTHAPVSACVTGDSCCPEGCFNDQDRDCASQCGNGHVETGETCDGNCPASCDDFDACTQDTLSGSVSACTARCTNTPITACTTGDGCCPAGCAGTDGDCGPRCGDGVIDGAETCDGNCPTSCSDGDPCTTDTLTGTAAACNVRCTHAAITTCTTGDGCCLGSCTQATDRDCPGGPRPAETCAAAATIAPGTYPNQTLDGYAADQKGGTGTNCRSAPGPDGFFRVDVPAGKRLFVSVTPTASSPDFDPVLSLLPLAACGAVQCTASVDHGFGGDPEAVVWLNTTGAAATMVIWLDAYGTESPRTFDLTVTVDDPAPGEACQSAIVLNASGSFPNQTTSLRGLPTASGATCSLQGDAFRVYAVDVPAGMHVDATVTAPAADPGVDLIAGTATACQSGTTCTATSDEFGKGVAEHLGFTNVTAQASRVYLVVNTNGEATFTLDLAVSAPPPGDNCGNALVITQPGTLAAQSMAGALNDFVSGTYCGGASGPDRVWVMTVPAGQRLTVSARSATLAPPKITLVPGTAAQCAGTGTTTCVQTEPPSTQAGATSQARWTNATGAAAQVYVRLDGAANGAYDLTTELSAPAAGDTCLAGVPLTAPQTVNDTTSGTFDDYAGYGTRTDSGCAPGPSFDKVYTTQIPAGKTLLAILRPAAGFDATLNAFTGAPTACDGAPRKCAAGSDAGGAGAVEAVRVKNPGTAAATAYLVVDAKTAGAAGAYSLQISTDPLPGDACDNAVPLALPANLPAETLVAYGADVVIPDACLGEDPQGNDRVYLVTVPPGKTLTVNVTPQGSDFDPVLALVAGPAAACASPTACLAAADHGVSGEAEVLTYANNTAAAQSYYLVVQHYAVFGGNTAGSFALTATLTP